MGHKTSRGLLKIGDQTYNGLEKSFILPPKPKLPSVCSHLNKAMPSSSSSSSSIYRRLHDLFTIPRSSSTRSKKPNPNPSLTKAPKKSTTTTVDSAETALNAERRLQKFANKFIKNSESPRFRARHGIYDSTIRRLASHHKFSMIQDIIESQKKYEDITEEGFAIRLIMLYGKAGMFSNAKKLFDELPDLNCGRTVKSFNALLASCVNSKEYDQVETIFRELPEKVSVEVNLISYNIVINAFCEMGSLDKAVLWFNDMEENGMEPDLVTFNTLLSAYYRNGQFLDGENLWNVMVKKGITPNIISYNSRLRGMVRENRIEQGVELVDEMEDKGIKPDVYSFNTLFKVFCDDGNLEEAKKWYHKLKENESTPNRSTYGILLPFFNEQGDFDLALELCKAAIDKHLVISVAEVQRVVDGLVEASKTEEAEELVQLGNSNKYLNFKLQLPNTGT